MSTLSHPNLVTLKGVQLSPKLCMCLEFVPGTDLAAVLHNPEISDTQFNWRLRTKIAVDIARGMRYLQALSPPIIHRDLRSPNVFVLTLNEEAEVCAKVADFGLASKVLTNMNEVLFTWQWLSPEEIDTENGAQYDERADVYSFGMVRFNPIDFDGPMRLTVYCSLIDRCCGRLRLARFLSRSLISSLLELWRL